MKRKLLSPILIIALVLVAIALWHVAMSDSQAIFHRIESVGRLDFSFYWTAFQLYKSGQNPYDVILQNKILRSLHENGLSPQVNCMYPPWLFVIMYPVLNLHFPVAAASWFVINLIFLFAVGGLICLRFRSEEIRSCIPAFIGLFFVPAIITLKFGQIGLLITASIAGLLYALGKKRDYLAGALLVIVIIKIHLFLMVGVLFCYWVVQEKRWGIPIGFAGTLALAMAINLYHSPGIFQFWFDNSREVQSTFLMFKTSTVTYLLREGLLHITGTLFDWPIYVVPLIGVMITGTLLFMYRPKIVFESSAPTYMILSLFCAPYAWIHDYTCLLIVQLIMLLYATRATVSRAVCFQVCSMLAIIQVASFLVAAPGGASHHFFWFAPALLAVWHNVAPKLGFIGRFGFYRRRTSGSSEPSSS